VRVDLTDDYRLARGRQFNPLSSDGREPIVTSLRRRQFLWTALGAVASAQPAPKPNILWITCEDMSPNLGCYGDSFARTPSIDVLSQKGLRYMCCWSNAPVCAPARTTIISGMYPPSLGAEHMRSEVPMGEGRKMFPQILREAGYYTSNNSKEDYNVPHTGKVWDESSPRAHWRKRRAGQPFFSVFNHIGTHESQIRTRPHEWRHSFEGVRVPAYHPDTPEVRQDWAQYYDNIEVMDTWAGGILKQLQDDGLADDTIVFFYSDHGSGMPRSKRWPLNSGLRVPLILHVPEKFRALRPPEYKAGAVTNRLVSFVDLAPTVLSLAGAPRPKFQQGAAFVGADKPRRHVFGFRGRMDERYDMVRSAFDGRYVYVRHYMPHRVYGEHVAYMFQTPTTAVWKRLYDEGKLNAAQSRFWQTKPHEELFDLDNDRDEVNDIASRQPAITARLRAAVDEWIVSTNDRGFLPEVELHNPVRSSYDVKKIKPMADLAASMKDGVDAQLAAGLTDADSAVRYWAAMGLLIRKKTTGLAALMRADDSPSVRAIAAEAVGRYGSAEEAAAAAEILAALGDMSKHGVYVAMLALNSLDALGPRNASVRAKVKQLPIKVEGMPQRGGGTFGPLIRAIAGS